mgnify:CR=1 FL=1
MDWAGVRSGSLQHRVLLFLSDCSGCGTTEAVAQHLFSRRDFKDRSRARSVLQALEHKDILVRVGVARWEIQTGPLSATNAKILHQLRVLQKRVQALEDELDSLKGLEKGSG